MKHLAASLLGTAIFLATGSLGAAPASIEGLTKIKHIVVIFLENHSFDSLYGSFPGVNGIIDAAPEVSMQTDLDGRLYEPLPPVMNAGEHGGKPVADKRFSKELLNEPFNIAEFVPPNQKLYNLPHRFFLHQQQIDGGRMDHYAALSNAGALVMGYYDARDLPMGKYAREYTLADNFFQAAFGGSFLNHQWLICGCTPKFIDAPRDMVTEVDNDGKIIKERELTPNGYAVGTVQPFAAPTKGGDARKRLPPQLQTTIGDRLSAKNISWAWYSGGWNNAVAGRPDATFQFHHQPFAYYQSYGPGSKGRAEHLKDGADFFSAIQQGALPAVTFYKPIGALSEHPGYADLLSGEQHVADIVDKIQKSPLWKDTAIIVTYDEYGGFWDHVPPPQGDDWGPGTRVPALVISPYAKRGFVDKTQYDTTSILKLIELRFGLESLGLRDEHADGMLNAFDFAAVDASLVPTAPTAAAAPIVPAAPATPAPRATPAASIIRAIPAAPAAAVAPAPVPAAAAVPVVPAAVAPASVPAAAAVPAAPAAVVPAPVPAAAAVLVAPAAVVPASVPVAPAAIVPVPVPAAAAVPVAPAAVVPVPVPAAAAVPAAPAAAVPASVPAAPVTRTTPAVPAP